MGCSTNGGWILITYGSLVGGVAGFLMIGWLEAWCKVVEVESLGRGDKAGVMNYVRSSTGEADRPDY